MLEKLLITFKSNGYTIIKFDNYWKNKKKYDGKEKVLLLRHDVDRFPNTALDIARIENSIGICGTYFFRAKPWTFKKHIIEEIFSLGHEIGYHYENLADTNGDYVKGNRLLHREVKESMPRYRLIGNSILTILTKFATGYFFLMDPQSGYTDIKNEVLKQIPIHKMTKGYGYNADILCMLNIEGFKVVDQKIKPVYGDEKSKIKLLKYMRKTSVLLVRFFFRRLWKRYVILDFHPLILFYLFAFLNTIVIIVPFTIRFLYMFFTYNETAKTTLLILVFTFLLTFQSVLFAIWMDMDYNKQKR